MRKSLLVLSAPFPVEDPMGRGAGTRLQFARRIRRASAQKESVRDILRSIPSAAICKTSEAFRKASSFPPAMSSASNAWTEGIIGRGLTVDAVSSPGVSAGFSDAAGILDVPAVSDCTVGPEVVGPGIERSKVKRSRAWDISPKATLLAYRYRSLRLPK